MKTDYKFANFIVRLDYEKEDYIVEHIKNLFRDILEEIKNSDNYDCLIEIVSTEDNFKIPQKAIRTKINNEELIFEYNKEKFLLMYSRIFISKDHKRKKTRIEYKKTDKGIFPLALSQVVYWLLVSMALEKGMTYFNGNMVNYNGKTIVLIGNSGLGKRYCLCRALEKGAKMMSNNAFVADKSTVFALPTKVEGIIDEGINFSLIRMRYKGLFDIPANIDYENTFQKIDKVIFINEWNNETSEFKEIDTDQAIQNLMMFNIKDDKHFFEEDFSNMEKSFINILKDTKSYMFYAGFNEKEIRKIFFNFINKIIEPPNNKND